MFFAVELTMCGGAKIDGGEVVSVPDEWVDKFKYFNLIPEYINLPLL